MELQVKQVCCSSRRGSWVQGVVDVIIVNTTNKNLNYLKVKMHKRILMNKISEGIIIILLILFISNVISWPFPDDSINHDV